jgi:hypothetical protein
MDIIRTTNPTPPPPPPPPPTPLSLSHHHRPCPCSRSCSKNACCFRCTSSTISTYLCLLLLLLLCARACNIYVTTNAECAWCLLVVIGGRGWVFILLENVLIFIDNNHLIKQAKSALAAAVWLAPATSS